MKDKTHRKGVMNRAKYQLDRLPGPGMDPPLWQNGCTVCTFVHTAVFLMPLARRWLESEHWTIPPHTWMPRTRGSGAPWGVEGPFSRTSIGCRTRCRGQRSSSARQLTGSASGYRYSFASRISRTSASPSWCPGRGRQNQGVVRYCKYQYGTTADLYFPYSWLVPHFLILLRGQ
jgi:hypothetical protein